MLLNLSLLVATRSSASLLPRGSSCWRVYLTLLIPSSSLSGMVAVKQLTGPARPAHTCAAHAHQLLSARYDHRGASQAELPDRISPSNASTFCTSMYSSSAADSSKSCRQAGALPFLPHPPKREQQQQQSSSSPSLLVCTDLGNGGQDEAEAEHPAELKDFLNLSGEASWRGGFHGESSGVAFRFGEQVEFQFLSEQLGIAITDHDESPRLDVSPIVPFHELPPC